MRPEPADLSRVIDMLRHARSAINAIGPRDVAAYAADDNLRLATERRIEIIGEAARHVSQPFQTHYKMIPWGKIIAQRHVLAHDYGEVDDELVWRVVTVHLAELVKQLEAIPGVSESL